MATGADEYAPATGSVDKETEGPAAGSAEPRGVHRQGVDSPRDGAPCSDSSLSTILLITAPKSRLGTMKSKSFMQFACQPVEEQVHTLPQDFVHRFREPFWICCYRVRSCAGEEHGRGRSAHCPANCLVRKRRDYLRSRQISYGEDQRLHSPHQ